MAKEIRSLFQVDEEKKALYGTKSNNYDDFEVGDKVQVITLIQDHCFFYDNDGVVIENKKSYLGIKVKFDEPIHYKDGSCMEDFNFQPEDLYLFGQIESRFDILDIK